MSSLASTESSAMRFRRDLIRSSLPEKTRSHSLDIAGTVTIPQGLNQGDTLTLEPDEDNKNLKIYSNILVVLFWND